MCGICGIASPAGPPDPDRLAAMNDALVHRGPDSGGMHLDGPVGLAARRLAIIDLTGGDQPMSSEGGSCSEGSSCSGGSCTVVQNGEIYNFPELRRELEREGHTFRTRSDTEVHLHLYEKHGPDFARRLRGMFAVAIWDARRRRLVLARDRYGIKPLYYRHIGGVLEFASEVRALPRGEIALDALEAQESTDAIHTFTIGFAERSFDERADARLVAERYGTNHHELLVRPDPTLLL